MKAVEPRRCIECGSLKPVFKAVEKRIGIRRGSTSYRVQTVFWCEECWKANEKWSNDLREKTIAESQKQILDAAKAMGIDTTGWK